jgi:hypothetical protein
MHDYCTNRLYSPNETTVLKFIGDKFIDSMSKSKYQNNEDRRSGNERRQYNFALHLPERRKHAERRKSSDSKQNENSLNQNKQKKE